MRSLVRSAAFVLAAIAAVGHADDLPLETTRNVQFETSQISWLSLDVHPENGTFVFEALGDLYTLPADGGTATRITEGPAFDSQPKYSPDGTKIVFVSDRSGTENLWISDADGSNAEQLTQEKGDAEFASPAFSPDGEHVIASRTAWGLRTFELWAYHLDGGKGVRITKAKATSTTPASARHNAIGATYTPDGRYLYYARKNGGFAYNVTFPTWQIARRDLTERREDILTFAPGSAMRPVLSPDGNKLVYATRSNHQTGLRIRDLTSGEDEWLAYPVERDEQESRFTRDLYPGYAFSGDGQHVFYANDGRIERVHVDSGETATIPMRVQIDQQLGPFLNFPYRLGTGPVKARLLQAPELSPNGEQLAFSAFGSIYVHSLTSERTRQITPGDVQAFHPTWSPDGRRIAFVSWRSDGGHIWRVNARGGRARQLTEHAAFYTDPAYNKAGDRIVALRATSYERSTRENDFGQPVGSEVIWLPASGGAANVVLPANGLGQPHFGPDPERIVLYLSRGPFAASGNGGLTSLRYDGTDRRTLLISKGKGIYRAESDIPSEDARLSPDGRYVLVQHANQLYLVARLSHAIGNVSQTIDSPKLPQVKLTDVGVDHFGWSADGSDVYWTVGHTFYRRPLSGIELSRKDDDHSPAEATGADEEEPAEIEGGPADDEEIVAEASPGEEDNKASDAVIAEEHESVSSHLIELYRARYAPEGIVAFTGATLLTMQPEQSPFVGTVVVEGNRIAAVGSDVVVPEGATVFDLSGKFLLPGFVDTHAHYPIMRRVLDRNNPGFYASLAYGVTTGLDVQPSTVDIIAYEDMIDAGLMTGPRTLSTGPGVFSNNAFKSAKQVEHILRRYRDHYGVRNLKAYLAGNRQQRQWLAQAAAKLKMMPTTEGGLDMKLNLTHILDGFTGNEHNFPIVPIYDDVVRLTAESQIAYNPTLLVTYGSPWAEGYFYTRESPKHDEKLKRFTAPAWLAARTDRRFWATEEAYTFDEVAEGAAQIVSHGGRVGVGAHGQLEGLGYHWELWALAAGGMSNADLLAAATRVGADIIGVAQDVGTISVGKLADLVVLDADPMEDIRNTVRLHQVIKNGEVFDASTLDKEWPTQEPLPAQWWWEAPP